MAVSRIPGSSVLRLQFQVGTDENGNPVYRNKNLSYVRASALDADLYDVAQALAGLVEGSLTGITRIDSSTLVSA